MDDRRGTGRRVCLSMALLAAAFAFPRDGFAQAIDIAPLVTPPLQKVLPTPSPEVLPPALAPAPAPEAIPPGPALHVDDVRLEGFTVYDADVLRPFYGDLIGANVPRERLLAAVDALQTRYREDGYVLTTVHGAAEHKNGRLVFVIRATEGYISSVKLDATGEIGSVGSLVLDILNHLTAVGPVRNADLERYLLLVNDIPGISAQAVLLPSGSAGAVDLVAKVARKPFGVQFQFDNRGSQQVGPYEALLTAQSNSFTGAGELVQGTFFNTFNREQLYGQVDVSLFLNSEGLKLRGYAGRGNTQPGGSLEGTGFNSDLQIAGAGLNYPVVRTRRFNLSVDAAFDTYDGTIDTFATGRLSDTHLRIVRFGGTTDFQDTLVGGLPAATYSILKFSQGLPAFGASPNSQAAPARPGERNDFTKITGELTRVQNLFALGDAQTALKTSVGGQYTGDILPPSEQYLLGGTRYGRGFFAGQVAGDRAIGATVELQLNTGFDGFGWLNPEGRLNVQFYNFYDYGRAYNLVPGQPDHTIDSIGLGARSNLTPWLYAELEGVRRLTTHPTGAAAAAESNYAVFSRVVLQY